MRGEEDAVTRFPPAFKSRTTPEQFTMENLAAAREQRAPTTNGHRAVQDLVIEDVAARKALGLRKYGTVLQPFNGRDALMDAYQEALDLAMYLRQAIEERNLERAGHAHLFELAKANPGPVGGAIADYLRQALNGGKP